MIHRFLLIFGLVGLVVLSGTTVTLAQETREILLTALAVEKPVSLCGEPVPIHEQDVIERYEKEMLISLGDRAQVILWMKRSTRYFPFIEKMLRERGLPDGGCRKRVACPDRIEQGRHGDLAVDAANGQESRSDGQWGD